MDVGATDPVAPDGVTELCCNQRCGSEEDDGGGQFCQARVESGADAIRVTFYKIQNLINDHKKNRSIFR